MNWVLVQNTLLVSGVATLAAMLAGLAAALCAVCLPPRGQRMLMGGALVAVMLPPFLVTNCWMDLLGEVGTWRAFVPWSIFSLGGTIWILTLLLWPITFLLVLGAWTRVDAALLEADPALAGWAMVRWLLWPLSRSALGLAALITFVLAANNFAVPAMLQVKVLPAELWVAFNTHLNTTEALLRSWPLLVVPLVVLWWLRGTEVGWPARARPATARAFRRQLGNRWLWPAGAITALFLLVSVALPLVQLAADARTWTELPKVWSAVGPVTFNSAWFAASAASLCIGAGCLCCRFRLGHLTWIPFLLPGIFLGVCLIKLFNRPGLQAVYGSFAIILLAWTLRYLAIGWHGVARALARVDRSIVEAARIDGATGWALFRHGWWPQIAPQVAAVWYLVFLLCLWEVEILVLIYPPGAETLALRIFNLLHYGHTTQVNALCVLLLALALVPMAAYLAWQQSKLHFWKYCWIMGAILTAVTITGCSADATAFTSQVFSGVEIIGGRGTALGQFNKPRSVAVDAQDNLYVVDMTGRVQKFSPQGEYLSSWQMPETTLGKPKGMCRDLQGNIVVLEPHYSRVNHYTPDGKLVAQWGVHGTNAGQLALPRAVVAAADGRIFVSEYGLTERVQCFAGPDHALVRVIGRAGDQPGEFNRPEGLGLDAAGRLYVADSCNHRIQVFAANGDWLRSYGRPGQGSGEMSYPYDVQIDAAGNQYVCEFGNSRIQVFDARHQAIDVLGGPGSAPGQFHNPWSIALDSHGNLYVADSGNHRVQKLIRRKPMAVTSR